MGGYSFDPREPRNETGPRAVSWLEGKQVGTYKYNNSKGSVNLEAR